MKEFVQESFIREGVINRVSKLVNEKIPNPVRLNRYIPRLPPDLQIPLRIKRNISRIERELGEPPMVKKSCPDVSQLASDTLATLD